MPLAIHLEMDVSTLLLSIQIFWPLKLFQQEIVYKGQQSLAFASCSSQSIQLACFMHLLCARHFFRMEQDRPQCLSRLSRRDSQMLQVPGAETVKTPWRLRGRSHCKEASSKSRKRGEGITLVGTLSIIHSSTH